MAYHRKKILHKNRDKELDKELIIRKCKLQEEKESEKQNTPILLTCSRKNKIASKNKYKNTLTPPSLLMKKEQNGMRSGTILEPSKRPCRHMRAFWSTPIFSPIPQEKERHSRKTKNQNQEPLFLGQT